MLEFRDIIDYDPLTGIFEWKVAKRGVRIGSIAGTINKHGYRSIVINRKAYRGARLAWYLTHGVWPYEIDHINGNRKDDRLSNLREVTHSENIINTKARTAHGEKNIYWMPLRKKWRTFIMRNYRNKQIGHFDSLEEAVKARDAYLARRGENANGL